MTLQEFLRLNKNDYLDIMLYNEKEEYIGIYSKWGLQKKVEYINCNVLEFLLYYEDLQIKIDTNNGEKK